MVRSVLHFLNCWYCSCTKSDQLGLVLDAFHQWHCVPAPLFYMFVFGEFGIFPFPLMELVTLFLHLKQIFVVATDRMYKLGEEDLHVCLP